MDILLNSRHPNTDWELVITMAGQRKRRQTVNPYLLRSAVSRMGRTKLQFPGNAVGGSTLYDVHEPRSGITVLPSIARDSHLVHIMQSSLSNNLRPCRNTWTGESPVSIRRKQAIDCSGIPREYPQGRSSNRWKRTSPSCSHGDNAS